MADPDQEAVAVAFKVTIERTKSLGWFTSCDGLGCEIVVEQKEEGGNTSFIHQLPGRIKYTNIKLTRVVNNKDADTVPRWISEIAAKGVTRTTAVVEARTAEGTLVAKWNLQGVIPVRWTGPSLSVESNKPATETLELAHHGFLPA